MAAGAAISIRIGEKTFPDRTIPLFRDFVLDVAPSEVVAITGPSGVGKSTLLRLVAGIDRDFGGDITVDGKPAHLASAPGFVFQDPRLLPWLSAAANIRAADPTVTGPVAEALLRDVGLSGSENTLPHKLSGGMQRRVAIARALSLRPQLLLLDEPFVALDTALAIDLQRLLAEFLEHIHPTVLFVTHSVQDAARLGDRIVLLAGNTAQIVAEVRPEISRNHRGKNDVLRIADAITQKMQALT